jgi:phage shock protein PspC (stress-responsive transcriptional regulator)
MGEEIKRLYRSRTDRVWLGILGGFGKYFGLDATILRVVFMFLLVVTGVVPFGFAYVLCYLIVPLEP